MQSVGRHLSPPLLLSLNQHNQGSLNPVLNLPALCNMTAQLSVFPPQESTVCAVLSQWSCEQVRVRSLPAHLTPAAD